LIKTFVGYSVSKMSMIGNRWCTYSLLYKYMAYKVSGIKIWLIMTSDV